MPRTRTPGRHRRPAEPTTLQRTLAATAAAGVIGTTATALSAPAQAASTTVWDAVAQCESGGDWSINTGNGYFGGLQFTAATWAAYGGHSFAAQASGATRAQQITVAQRVLGEQGPGAWPVCGPRAGLSKNSPAPVLSAPVLPQHTSSAKVTSALTRGLEAIAFARAQVGKAYVYGGDGPNVYDCSGLTQAAWRRAGVTIPRTSQAQLDTLPRVSLAHLQPGDIVGYFGGSHVALYIGSGLVLGAENPSTGIRIMPLNWGHQRAQEAVRPLGSGTVVHSVPAAPTKAQGAPVNALPKTPPPVPYGDTYVVKPGDWLDKIARAEGLPNWQLLYDLNRGVVGANPDYIVPGEVLEL